MAIRIITDSSADFDSAVARRRSIDVVPMSIQFGDASFLSGRTLSNEVFYKLLQEKKENPTTSQPTPEAFLRLFQQAREAGDQVVAVVLSAKLSGTYQSACIAAEEFPGKVFVVDSANATIGELVLVERAVELMDQGLEAAAIADRLEREREDIRLVGLLDTLEYLKKGGRVSASVAMVGGLLSIKPVVAVQEGEVVMLGKARGSKNGNNLLIQEIQKNGGVDFGRPYRLGYAGLNDSLLQKYIADSAALWEGHTDALPICTVGGTIGTHVGPGAVAVAFFRNPAGE